MSDAPLPPVPPTPEPVLASEPAPRSRRVPLLIAAVLGVAALGGAGAFAWTTLSGGGTQPHDVLPSTVVGYARIDLDPSASQKIAALRLLRKLPDFDQETGVRSEKDDLREILVEEMFGECDVDFAKDVDPWLGERLGFGLIDDGVNTVVALQITDETKARAGIAKFDACGDEDTESGVVFTDGYALVAQTQKLADRFAKQAEKKTLADVATFRDDMDRLGEQGVASAWFDLERALATEATRKALDLSGGATDFFEALDTDDLGSISVALEAESDALVLHGVSTVGKSFLHDGDLDPSRIDADALVVYGFSIGGKGEEFARTEFEKGWQQGVEEEGLSEGEFADFEKNFEAFTGVTIEEYKEATLALFLNDPLLVVGARNLDDVPNFARPEDVATLDIALHLTGGEGADALDLLNEAAATFLGVELERDSTEGRHSLATSERALQADAPLTENAAFRSVIEEADAYSGLFFLDLDALVPVLEEWEVPEEFLDNVTPLRAVGMSAHGSDFTAKVSFD